MKTPEKTMSMPESRNRAARLLRTTLGITFCGTACVVLTVALPVLVSGQVPDNHAGPVGSASKDALKNANDEKPVDPDSGKQRAPIYLKYQERAESIYDDIEIKDSLLTYVTLAADLAEKERAQLLWTRDDLTTMTATLSPQEVKAVADVIGDEDFEMDVHFYVVGTRVGTRGIGGPSGAIEDYLNPVLALRKALVALVNKKFRGPGGSFGLSAMPGSDRDAYSSAPEPATAHAAMLPLVVRRYYLSGELENAPSAKEALSLIILFNDVLFDLRNAYDRLVQVRPDPDYEAVVEPSPKPVSVTADKAEMVCVALEAIEALRAEVASLNACATSYGRYQEAEADWDWQAMLKQAEAMEKFADDALQAARAYVQKELEFERALLGVLEQVQTATSKQPGGWSVALVEARKKLEQDGLLDEVRELLTEKQVADEQIAALATGCLSCLTSEWFEEAMVTLKSRTTVADRKDSEGAVPAAMPEASPPDLTALETLQRFARRLKDETTSNTDVQRSAVARVNPTPFLGKPNVGRPLYVKYHYTAETVYEEVEIKDSLVTYVTLAADFAERTTRRDAKPFESRPLWTRHDLVTMTANLSVEELEDFSVLLDEFVSEAPFMGLSYDGNRSVLIAAHDGAEPPNERSYPEIFTVKLADAEKQVTYHRFPGAMPMPDPLRCLREALTEVIKKKFRVPPK